MKKVISMVLMLGLGLCGVEQGAAMDGWPVISEKLHQAFAEKALLLARAEELKEMRIPQPKSFTEALKHLDEAVQVLVHVNMRRLLDGEPELGVDDESNQFVRRVIVWQLVVEADESEVWADRELFVKRLDEQRERYKNLVSAIDSVQRCLKGLSKKQRATLKKRPDWGILCNVFKNFKEITVETQKSLKQAEKKGELWLIPLRFQWEDVHFLNKLLDGFAALLGGAEQAIQSGKMLN